MGTMKIAALLRLEREGEEMILDIGHVALQVADVDAAAQFAVEVLGMHETERTEHSSYLTMTSSYPSMGRVCPHHVIEYRQGPETALDHVGLIAEDDASLDEAARRAVAHGATLLGDGPAPGIKRAVRIAAPSGHVFWLYVAMDKVDVDDAEHGVRPQRLGHVNLWAQDVPALVQFWVDAFGFKISDWIRDPETGEWAGFARCHLEHHTLAAAQAPVDGIYHYAMELSSVSEIARLGDLLGRRREGFLWGPVRHGAGDNVAAYLVGPGGVTIEVYADMQKISDPTWEPRVWTDAELPTGANTWGPQGGASRMAFKSGLAKLPASR